MVDCYLIYSNHFPCVLIQYTDDTSTCSNECVCVRYPQNIYNIFSILILIHVLGECHSGIHVMYLYSQSPCVSMVLLLCGLLPVLHDDIFAGSAHIAARQTFRHFLPVIHKEHMQYRLYITQNCGLRNNTNRRTWTLKITLCCKFFCF